MLLLNQTTKMMNTNQKIASTLLTSRLRQLLVAVLSVTFGISMYVFMNSFMAGVNNEQTEITFTSMPHIRIYNDLALTEIRVPNKMNRSTENERFCFGAEGEAGFCSALSFGA